VLSGLGRPQVARASQRLRSPLHGKDGEFYFAPAGALERVTPAGGANWAAAQEGAGIDFVFIFFVFFAIFSCFFLQIGFLRFLSGFRFF
jgi:hypothetical protein